MSSVEESLIARFKYKKDALRFCTHLGKVMTALNRETWALEDLWPMVHKVGNEYILELYGYPLLGRVCHYGEIEIGKVMSDLAKESDDADAFAELTVTYDVSSDAEIYTFLKEPFKLLVKRSLYSPDGLWSHYCSECGYKISFPLLRLDPETFDSKIKCPKCGTVEKHELQIGYSVFNCKTNTWNDCDDMSKLFLKNTSNSLIDIDCKDKEPRKVANLLIKAITRLYARTARLEYGGWAKIDREMEYVVKTYICRPEICGDKIHIELWDNVDGPRLLHEQFGDFGHPVNEYGFNQLTTYEHAFKSFYAKCKGIEFTASINIVCDCVENKKIVFYSHEGEILYMYLMK